MKVIQGDALRRGDFSLAVGKYVVKWIWHKREELDLCCKYTCLRDIWQYAEKIICDVKGCVLLL